MATEDITNKVSAIRYYANCSGVTHRDIPIEQLKTETASYTYFNAGLLEDFVGKLAKIDSCEDCPGITVVLRDDKGLSKTLAGNLYISSEDLKVYVETLRGVKF